MVPHFPLLHIDAVFSGLAFSVAPYTDVAQIQGQGHQAN